MAFPKEGQEFAALAVSASNLATGFLRFYGEMFERPKHLVDSVKRLPFVRLPAKLQNTLEQAVRRQVEQRRLFYRNYEPHIDFLVPAKVRRWVEGAVSEWNPSTLLGAPAEAEVAEVFGLSTDLLEELEYDLSEAIQVRRRSSEAAQETDEDESGAESSVVDMTELGETGALFSYFVGCAFGRWDIRYATGEQSAPELPGPFAPLPICPPGMLQSNDGLPLSPEVGRRLRAEGRYPLDVAWDGILVDDLEHPHDLERRVHAALAVLWRDRVDDIQQEACALFGVPSLREWFRRPAGFFADHLKRYSKSRRQAPIYWMLSTGNGNYSVWLYYHRFTADTLYRVLQDYVDPRISQAERDCFEWQQQAASGGTADAAQQLQSSLALLDDLKRLKAELSLVAPLWNPNLNDGVIINHAILWRITPHATWQKKVKECWDKLVNEEYEWAHLAFHLWPERVIPKCATDRSLAIAHGLDATFWRETQQGKWELIHHSEEQLAQVVAAHTNHARRDALKRFLSAPPPLAASRGRAPRVAKSASPGTRRAVRTTQSLDPELIRQVRLVLTAAPPEGMAKATIAELHATEDGLLNAVIKQLKENGQIEQLGQKRGARYRLSPAGLAAAEADGGMG